MKKIIIEYLSRINDLLENSPISCSNERDLEKFTELKKTIKIIMIMRKHTLGYLDFLRGNYDENKHDTIVPLVEQMITSEIQKIQENINNFDLLCNDVL